LFILLVFLVFLVNLNYTWEMSTWLSFFINLHHYTGITDLHDYPKEIYNNVDAVLILDTTAANEENKQTYATIKANLAAGGKEEPY
ncbi:hypothetical protein ACTQ2W_04230, partial [Ligilactobacillus ruminis]